MTSEESQDRDTGYQSETDTRAMDTGYQSETDTRAMDTGYQSETDTRAMDTGYQSETYSPCNGEIPSTDTEAQPDANIHESSPDTGQRRPSIRKCARWDVFKQHPPEEIKDRDASIRRAQSFLKIIVIILFFLLILFGLMVNKATVFMATAQISRTHHVSCVGYGNTSDHVLAEVCVAHAQGTTLDPNSLYCSGVHGLKPRSVNGHLPNCPETFMRWLWCLLLFMIIPYICIIARDMWLICFKNEPNPRKDVFIVSMAVDTISTIGMCYFVFRVLPGVDNTLTGISILMGTSVVPSFLLMFNIPKDSKKSEQPARHDQDEATKDSSNNSNDMKNTARKAAVICLNISAFVAQVSVLLFLPINRYIQHPEERFYVEMPVSMIMISVGWWENYADPAWNFFCDRQKYKMGADATGDTFLKSLREAKVKLSLAGNIWKVVLTILMAFVIHTEYKFIDWFDFLSGTMDCENYWGSDVVKYYDEKLKTDWVILLALGIFDTIAVYFLVRTCAKIRIQAATIGMATLLVTPVMLGSMALICYHWTDDVCVLSELRPLYMFWSCNKQEIEDFFFVDYGWITIFWWLSQVWVSRHIWSPTADRLAKSKHLFVNPLVDAIILGPWVLHNRRRIDDTKAEKKTNPKLLGPLPEEDEDEDVVPMVYMCATMWHENRAETMEILKSIFRNDMEQFKRKLFKETLNVKSSDYYEFEAHIFFDDAMTAYDSPEDEHTVNDFVKMLVEAMDDAASVVHQENVHVEGPIRYTTPYGGRLEWKMPGENKLIAHLKDKNKIRHKKRWSQVMYMYYLLGYDLMNKIRSMPDRSRTKRCQVAENTFLLALDGDVEFKPDAVHKLVDLMKKDKKVGAACGRIHPVGTGPMVWYQLFEYAIGHWLQKSTEHVLGSVLCSPGCFSLFRGSALMDSNVARTYATLPSEAKHYVQYDQGEDRWLCTLLLQQGYRVEYCAASDAYTFAPEGFYEFFNQRRRWMPSTMANIMDLLLTWKTTIKKNDNISLLYIIYQAVLLVASILGTGTIFLMIIGALKITSQDAITLTQSFLLNMVPIIIFIIICYVCKSSVQLFVSAVMTVAYSLLQMLVLVGVVIQIAEDGPSSPNAIFFFFVAGTFVLAALLHPQESLCVVHGFIYFLAVPSMYMLLMIYALTNLHVISWGTREVVQTKTEKEEQEEKKAAEEAKKAEKKGLPFVNLGSASANEEGFTLSLGNLCRCICCPRDLSNNPTTRPDGYQRLELAVREVKVTLDEAIDRGKLGRDIVTEDEPDLHDGVTRGAGVHRSKSALSTVSRMSCISRRRLSMRHTGSVNDEPLDDEGEGDVKQEEPERKPKKEWIDNDVFTTGEKASLPPEEEQFFEELITTYLKPLAKDKKREEKIQQELIELRNKMSGTFLLLNAIFIVVVFTLQQNVDSVHLVWPWGTSKDGSPLMLEPVGLMFLSIFGAIMVLQVWGMVSHRFTTFQHILSTTTLPCEKHDYDDKRLQESTRETIFDSLMYRKGSVYSTLYDDDDGTPKIKVVKTSTEIAKTYRQKLIDFKEDPLTLEKNLPEGELKRTASMRKRTRALTYLRMESKAPGLKTPETRRRGKSDLSTTNSTWHRDIDRALSDAEMATLPAESSSGPLDTCKFETESIGPCSIAGDSHCEQENTASRRNTQTDMDSETALIPAKNYFTTDL